MTNELSERDRALFEEIVLGAVDPDSDAARERAASSEPLASAIAEWRAVRDGLDRVRDEEPREWAAALENITGDDRRLVREALAPHLDGARDRSRSRRTLLLVAVAASVLLLVFLRMQTPAPVVNDGPLGSEVFVRPRGDVEAFEVFEVDVQLEPWQYVEMVVYDAAGEELLRSGRLKSPSWELSPTDAARLEGVRSIRWVFDVRNTTDELISTGGPCEASLSH